MTDQDVSQQGAREGAPSKEMMPALRHFLFDAGLRSALFAFCLTRSIVLIVFVMTSHLIFQEQGSPDQQKEPFIVLTQASVREKLRTMVLANDAGWYFSIVQGGYNQQAFSARQSNNWAFFPLYPLLWRLASKVTGRVALTGVALSNLFFLVALILLYKTVIRFGYDEGVADRTVFYIAAFPSSYFFSLPWTESLFLCLTVGSIYAAKRDAWWVAGSLGALASATRVSGIFLLPTLLILYLQRHRGRPRPDILSLMLVPAGLGAFICYLYLITGNPLAFKDILVTWGREPGFFLATLYEYLKNPLEVAEPWNFKLLNFLVAIMALICGGVLLKRREWALGLYSLVSVIVPMSTTILMSISRYVLVVFPVFLVLATSGRSPRVDQFIRAVFIVLLGLMSALFAAGVTIAGA